MSAPTLANIAVYSTQVAIVVGGAGIAAAACRPTSASGRLAFWRAVVIVCLALPLAPALSALPSLTGAAGRSVFPLTNIALTIHVLDTARSRWGVVRLIPALLLLGAFVRAAYLALGVWRLCRIQRASASIRLDAGVDAPARAVAPTADFRFHESITEPITSGFGRSIVFVPRRLLDLAVDEQRAALLHEAFHVARHDWISVLVEELIRSIFWFHPAMWWAIDRIQLSREQLIDDLVVRTLGTRRAYVRALLSFADVLPAPPVAVPSLGRHHLPRRIDAISAHRRPSAFRSSVAAMGLVVALAAAVAGATSLSPLGDQRSDETVYEPGNGVTLPSVVTEVRPVYTEAAKKARIQGTVMMSCVVTTDGGPDRISIIRSLDPVNGLDEAALDALKQWRFKPGRKDGRPVAVRVEIEMTFTLK